MVLQNFRLRNPFDTCLKLSYVEVPNLVQAYNRVRSANLDKAARAIGQECRLSTNHTPSPINRLVQGNRTLVRSHVPVGKRIVAILTIA